VSWTSSDNGVAAASNAVGTQGLASGIDVGSATITATIDGISGTTTVTVIAVTLQSITISPDSPTISKGTTIPLMAIGHFSDGSTQDLTALVSWASSDHTVAHVISSHSSHTNGRLKGNKPGTATITATYAGITGSTIVTVTP
jgi:hypothetical protein